MSPTRLIAILSTVPEHRVERSRVHKLVDVLVISLLAAINGASGWEEMAEFADVRTEWLRTFLELPKGVPCADTFRRIYEAMDVNAFAACMQEITKDLNSDIEGRVVAIDGKTLRGSFDKRRGLSALHIVSAWAVDSHLSLGQIATDAKSNEITAIPALLKTIDVNGATVTIDAMGCQKKIAEAIVEAGADYALALKENHPTMEFEVRKLFESETPTDVCEVESKGHGRHEVRRVAVCTDLSKLSQRDEWTNLRSVVKVERQRTIGDHTSKETAYYLTSLTVAAATMEQRVRAHWAIENSLHWTLDVVFGEDRSRIRSRAGATNLAAVRKLALTLLKLEPSCAKKSIAMKRKRAGWAPDYAFQILRGIS